MNAIKRAIEEDFVNILKDSLGDNLYSVVVYGSYATTGFRPGVSDVNVLILSEESAARSLKSLSKRAHRLMRRRRITPLLLTRGEFLTSADVFPMEYMDMQARHSVLYGPDPTGELTFSQDNLRHQLEHQLRGSLVSLRQLVLSAKGSGRLLGRYLKRWYGSIGAIFRGVLRLSGTTELPQTPEELVRQMNDSLGLEAGPFLTLLGYRSGERTDPNALATELLIRLESLVAIVDAFEAKDA
jgi:predicted nucleotidyltransferase